jgi:hypothetical protein
MSEKRRWLRFCYKSPMEYYDPELEVPEDGQELVGGWIYRLLAIRSDGYFYQTNCFFEEKVPDEGLEDVRKQLRLHLETMIDEIPERVQPTDGAEHLMKGIVYQNGDEWVEATYGTVEELK